eukprot:604175-Rhodomonas_salina.1
MSGFPILISRCRGSAGGRGTMATRRWPRTTCLCSLRTAPPRSKACSELDHRVPSCLARYPWYLARYPRYPQRGTEGTRGSCGTTVPGLPTESFWLAPESLGHGTVCHK